jgi:hypothetical protein
MTKQFNMKFFTNLFSNMAWIRSYHLYALCFACSLLSGPLLANHILGGSMTYSYNSLTGQYDFKMKITRDCNCTNCAGYDSPAHIAVYIGNSEPYLLIRELAVYLYEEPANVPAPDIQCTNAGFCIEEGLYLWSLDLPLIDESYHIVYQRCCRVEVVNNIVNPGANGITCSVELLPLAQQLHNSSPVFNNQLPIVFCAGENTFFNYSATDVEGDILVYEICSPLYGAGPAGGPDDPSGDSNDCDGVQPNPSCPPPFTSAIFIQPEYSFSNPFGSDPPFSIDAVSGMLSGIPTIQGRFLIGVCVSEYRNGELLSVIRKEMTVTVMVCGFFDADFSIPDLECNNLTVQFQNLSSGAESYLWTFGNPADPGFTSDATNPTYAYNNYGTYEVQLVINAGTECEDISQQSIVLDYTEAVPLFQYQLGDDCLDDIPIYLTDVSQDPDIEIAGREWIVKKGNYIYTSTDINPVISVAGAGNWLVELVLILSSGCEISVSETIPVCTGVAVLNIPDFPTMRISPNPVSDMMQLTFSQPIGKEVTISIINITGISVFEKEITGIQHTLNIGLPILPPGVYYVSLASTDFIISQPIIVE